MSGLELARRATIFHEVFRGYEGPAFGVRLWDGWTWAPAADRRVECTVVLKHPKALRTLIASPGEITLGEAFIHGELDVEGDIFAAFPMAEFLFSRPRTLVQRVTERLGATRFGAGRWLRHGRVSSQSRDRASIAYHYDQPPAFYEPWLGESMVYSCAYFRSEEDSLDQAQAQKLDLICRKLRLEPGDHFLDIGCGWGKPAAGGGPEAAGDGPRNHAEPGAGGDRAAPHRPGWMRASLPGRTARLSPIERSRRGVRQDRQRGHV